MVLLISGFNDCYFHQHRYEKQINKQEVEILHFFLEFSAAIGEKKYIIIVMRWNPSISKEKNV